MNFSNRIAVIGAGISGLTAAYRLKQAGMEPVVFDVSDYVGGRIQSIQRGDFLFDIGAFIYLGSYRESVNLMKEVGIEEELSKFKAFGAMPRNEKLYFLDFEKPFSSIIFNGYLSTGSKLKALKLLWLLIKYRNSFNYHDATGIAQLDNDTVYSYCQRELNDELYNYLASVVIRGPWLANPENASIGQLLWTLKNFFKPYFYGLDFGMASLPRALATHFEVKLKHRVTHVAEGKNFTEVTYQDDTGVEKTERFDASIITTTTDQALKIFPQMKPGQKAFYQATQYITSVNTHICLSKRPENPATYIMCSPLENKDLCGVIVDHLKARNRATENKGQLTIFCRHEWCVENLETPDEQVLDKVLGFIKPYYGDLANHIEDFEIGRWPLVVPMMNQGRFKEIAKYQKGIDPKARVQFAGDLAPIGGVNAALVSGESAAKCLIGSLS